MKEDNIYIGLDIKKEFSFPEKYISKVFYMESNYTRHIMSEHESSRNERFFCLLNPEGKSLIDSLGEQGTHTLNKLILSYLEASIQIWKFSGGNLNALDPESINLEFIENNARNHHINKYSLGLKKAKTNLVEYDVQNERILNTYHTGDSNLAETVFAMNIDEIFKTYEIEKINIDIKEVFNTSDFDQSIMKMVNNGEFGMVILQWISLNDYDSIEFSAGIYKIIEYIKNDIRKNEDKFKNDNDFYKCLIKLIHIVTNKESKYFTGFLNDTASLGVISRHGSSIAGDNKILSNHVRVQSGLAKNNDKQIADIYEALATGTNFPSISQLNYLYSFWHYTTSLIICSWFLTREGF